ncbi:hypothetical protein CONLIGDRAFT_225702 [Coniochaeta ligniaria NRRL 30616]|uniref:Uncharacterized protein n=1 Tax=Coniochaeta ligniaria NRRL 30616 TaxID=1408157 RepID=A0A1J7I3W6_9PEZI|nr:hypothetical protein CONLIGDRAFT_225702 [Coniochaeta ligniaria NRRL 30616]
MRKRPPPQSPSIMNKINLFRLGLSSSFMAHTLAVEMRHGALHLRTGHDGAERRQLAMKPPEMFAQAHLQTEQPDYFAQMKMRMAYLYPAPTGRYTDFSNEYTPSHIVQRSQTRGNNNVQLTAHACQIVGRWNRFWVCMLGSGRIHGVVCSTNPITAPFGPRPLRAKQNSTPITAPFGSGRWQDGSSNLILVLHGLNFLCTRNAGAATSPRDETMSCRVQLTRSTVTKYFLAYLMNANLVAPISNATTPGSTKPGRNTQSPPKTHFTDNDNSIHFSDCSSETIRASLLGARYLPGTNNEYTAKSTAKEASTSSLERLGLFARTLVQEERGENTRWSPSSSSRILPVRSLCIKGINHALAIIVVPTQAKVTLKLSEALSPADIWLAANVQYSERQARAERD